MFGGTFRVLRMKLRWMLGLGLGMVARVSSSQVTIGRNSGNDLVLDHPSVSSRHAVIHVSQSLCLLIDCGSTNGTFLRSEGKWRTISQHVLGEHEELRFGDYAISAREVRRRLGWLLQSAAPAPKSELPEGPKVRCMCGAVRPLQGACPTCGALG